MRLGPILRQLEKEKKSLAVALFLLLGIGIIRLPAQSPKSTETVGFLSIPQAVHRAFPGADAFLSDNAPIGLVYPGNKPASPEEESKAYFVAKGIPGVVPVAGFAVLPNDAGGGLLAKI
ncbi:MAG: hypothetical protein LiPW15_788 [Parcubacteria group bacterium LiPW_15]|nr:MAG: hypothetical protein LiPW15_788 [Parcubacteria group bacterium LiPW_15]